MLQRNAACALRATPSNLKPIQCDISAKIRSERRRQSEIAERRLLAMSARRQRHFEPAFEFRGGLFSNIRFEPRRHFVGGRDGPFAVRNCPRRNAQRAAHRNVLQRGVGARARNLLAGAGALRHAASVPKAVRGLHGNRLLDRNGRAKVRLRKALNGPLIAANQGGLLVKVGRSSAVREAAYSFVSSSLGWTCCCC